ncbi:cysteine-rich protein 2-binding protein [Teleopsis dalmanni]|uniref:cysteine-rich protein 2-binding protein n=1 Tax=Teleopsis dalmanni TaxID=139649 RepID=UPI0018CEBD69|nr:cysteine-rich protein 2-binding protein [Teleopsis dalmanni]
MSSPDVHSNQFDCSEVKTDDNANCCICDNLCLSNEYLSCMICEYKTHIKCLKSKCTPGDLHGDVFFDMTCSNCVAENFNAASTSTAIVREKFERQQLPWLMIITLTIYNLSIKAQGLSNCGYFHWRSHICSFIDKNWNILFPQTTRRRKNWIGSISGTLSHNNPKFFLSGHEVFNEAGWWKLAFSNYTPLQIFTIYKKQLDKRQKKRSRKAEEDHDDTSENSDTSSDAPLKAKRNCIQSSEHDLESTKSCARSIPYMGLKSKNNQKIVKNNASNKKSSQEQNLSTVQSNLLDFLAESFGNDDFSYFSDFSNMESEPLNSEDKSEYSSLIDTHNHQIELFDSGVAQFGTFENPFEALDNDFMCKKFNDHFEIQAGNNLLGNESTHNLDFRNDKKAEQSLQTTDCYQPRLLQITTFEKNSGSKKILVNAENSKNLNESDSENVSDNSHSEPQTKRNVKRNKLESIITPCKPNLFTKKQDRAFPWVATENVEKSTNTQEGVSLKPEKRLALISIYEEKELLTKFRKVFSLEKNSLSDIPAYVRRFYRKLCIRDYNRSHNKNLFNIHNHLKGRNNLIESKSKIIDRFHLISLTPQESLKTFNARMAGIVEYEVFESPYSLRTLHPFIYRDTKCMPLMLQLHCELQLTINSVYSKRASIDYCYVRPNHIPAINALLECEFWPGIDMSECLSYPDYTVVAMYKKLVVGCAFLTPDVGYNEAYLSFMAVRCGWQRCGIGSFMLYHLVQTCMDKDIILHVSASNSAALLYQKFGFKFEEIIIDFYDKYLPIDSKQSRNAIFLRLAR